MAKSLPGIIICMPVAVYVLCFATVINARPYYGFYVFNNPNLSADVIKAISDDIVDQVIVAWRDGKNTMELYVPVYGREDNWPMHVGMGRKVSKALYVHGIIDREIEITVVPTEEMNKKYHLK